MTRSDPEQSDELTMKAGDEYVVIVNMESDELRVASSWPPSYRRGTEDAS